MRPTDDPAMTFDGAVLAAEREWRRAERLQRLLDTADKTIAELREKVAEQRAALIKAYTRD